MLVCVAFLSLSKLRVRVSVYVHVCVPRHVLITGAVTYVIKIKSKGNSVLLTEDSERRLC